jgi:hypothetical protein
MNVKLALSELPSNCLMCQNTVIRPFAAGKLDFGLREKQTFAEIANWFFCSADAGEVHSSWLENNPKYRGKDVVEMEIYVNPDRPGNHCFVVQTCADVVKNGPKCPVLRGMMGLAPGGL